MSSLACVTETNMYTKIYASYIQTTQTHTCMPVIHTHTHTHSHTHTHTHTNCDELELRN